VTSGPDPRPPFDRESLEEAFAVLPDLELELLTETASTNQVAAERARAGAGEGLVVVADHQTAGRGRLDRTWETPPGTAVTFSMLLRPTVPPATWPWLPLLTGHTVAKALRAEGYDARVKWPNDVLVDERKVAGILVERVDTPDGAAAVVGVGVNVGLGEDELPVPTATSLAIEADDSGGVPSRDSVLLDVVTAIREGYDTWQVGGEGAAARLASSYAESCATIGQRVRVDLPTGEAIVGQATAIDPDGRLVVETESGPQRVGAGDVVHVRTAT
jgi:BirA family biotin operon repressor/biotin-[acetyl-CoA-carboxylase] ligase